MINIAALASRLISKNKFKRMLLSKAGYRIRRNKIHSTKSVPDASSKFVKIDKHLSKDSKCVYHAGRIISRDALHFELIGEMDSFTFYKDQHSIFVNGFRFDGVDINSFEPLRHGYARDKTRVYLMGNATLKTIKGADSQSFQVINQYYSLDKKHVYWRGSLLTDCEPSTYEALNDKKLLKKTLTSWPE
jgi:hypothetical protein